MALIDNLVAYWPLDEASGNAIDAHAAHDLAETSGTIAAAAGPGTLAGSRDFEVGDTEWFQVADHADLSTGDIDFTIAAWIQIESDTMGNAVTKWSVTGNQREYRIFYNATANRLRFEVSSDGTLANVVGITADNFGDLSAGVWVHVVAWHDSVSNEIGIAINGGTANTASHSAGVFDGTAIFSIGSRAGAESFDGLMSQAALWKRVLTSDERTELYNSGNGRDYAYIAGGAAGLSIPVAMHNYRRRRAA